MKISIAATNPCHVWQLACELQDEGGLSRYYSGYPAWKLGAKEGFPLKENAWRTLATYFLHGRVPERFRPSNTSLFRWQDDGFDRWVARVLEPTDFHHGIPGQCVHAFRRARELKIPTVLNHATGPAAIVARLLESEYARLGMTVDRSGGYEARYLDQVAEETFLADYHCCASTVVRDQLVEQGVPADRIMVVPYGADPGIWNPGSRSRREDDTFRLLFAGQVSVRKGLRFLLDALAAAGSRDWRLDVCGPLAGETRQDREAYRGQIPVRYHGAVSQMELAERMRQADLLVLPSLEEGFGLVVVQALACGLPCVVSESVGAKDLLTRPEWGETFVTADSRSLLEVLERRSVTRGRVEGAWTWREPALQLIAASRALEASRPGNSASHTGIEM